MNIKEIRKKCKENNIKIWTRDEIIDEYRKTGQDRNYLYLKLIGKPFFLVTPTHAYSLEGAKEFVAYEDLKPFIKQKSK